jgi:cyclophilin family peptidyl-prolyl cis-trans isomerase
MFHAVSFPLLRKIARFAWIACLFSLLATRLHAVDLTLATTNVTMPSNRTFQMPLTGSDPQESPLTFSIVSISDANVTGVIAPSSNRSLLLNISGVDATNGPFTGDLVLQLYEDLVPLTTARIIQLTQTNFYNGLTFHRVVQDFVAQGGDPLGNGTGGTGVKFDDEFVASLTFTGFGQLAMANSGDDSNDSQFFITDVDLSVGDPSHLPPRHLDFNHTIFGQVTKGFDVMTKIMQTPVNSTNDAPLTPVVINSAVIFTDTQDAVLRLAAAAGFTGTVDVTVSAMNTNSESASEVIQVTVISNTVNSAAFLGPIPSSLITTQNTAVSFILTATDIDNDTMSPILVDANTGQFPLNLQASLNPGTGLLTLTPDTNFTGVINMIIGVKDATHAYDTQHFSLTVNACSYALGAAGDSFPADGGTGSVTVTAAGGCSWTATNTNSWIGITQGTNGAGNNTVLYTVATNVSANARSGTLTIAGHTYTVSQDGVACSYALNSNGTNHTAGATIGSFGVTTPSGCPWSASTTDTWIHTTSSGNASGTVNYSVDANPDLTPRSGDITVQGHIFTVTQDGASCSYSISVDGVSVGFSTTNGTVDVTTIVSCDWTAASNDSWITIDSGTNGTGNGTVSYTVDVNPGITQRIGTVSIAGKTFTVTQAANTVNYGLVMGDWDVTLVSSLKISKVLSNTRMSNGQCMLFPEGDFDLLEQLYGPTPIASGTYTSDAKGKNVLFVMTPDGQAQLRLFLLAWLAEAAAANGVSVENADLSIAKLKVGKAKIGTDGQLAISKLKISGLFTGTVAGVSQSTKFSCSISLTFGQKHDL